VSSKTHPFAFGGGLSIYEGISRLRHPILPEHVFWNYLVLTGAAAFEFYSWQVSYLELRSRKDSNETVFDEIIGSKAGEADLGCIHSWLHSKR